MRSYEFTAKSVEKAIKLGLETLNKKQEDVDIKILSEGGLFKKAKIVINIEDEPVKTSFSKQHTESENKVVKEEEPKEVKVEILEGQQTSTQIENLENNTETVNEFAEESKIEKAVETQTPPPVLEKIKTNNQTSKEFVNQLLEKMNVSADVELKETKDSSQITVSLEDAGNVIGYRGECLSAIQYLANIVEQKHNKDAKRVVIDAGDYKKKREQHLRDLAIKVAGKVEATGIAYKFKPMNAYERRIIHTELQNYGSVETHSEGVEPNRKLIVTKKSK